MGAFFSVHEVFLRNLPYLLAFRKKSPEAITPKIVSIFELPQVFLNKLMRKMLIRDRLNLRLTCHEFENLVAESHAGHFERGKIARDKHDQDKIYAFFGDVDCAVHFTHFEFNASGAEQFQRLRSRLFSKISISGVFKVELDSNVLTADVLCKILENFELDQLCLVVDRESLIDESRKLLSQFSTRRYSLNLRFLPETELLLALPRLEGLYIRGKDHDPEDDIPWQISSFVFFNLLGKHENLYLDHVQLTAAECERALQTFLTETEAHSVEIMMRHSVITTWLETHGVTEDVEQGDVCGELTAVHISVSRLHLQFDYKSSGPNRDKCRVRVTCSQPLWANESACAILCLEKDW